MGWRSSSEGVHHRDGVAATLGAAACGGPAVVVGGGGAAGTATTDGANPSGSDGRGGPLPEAQVRARTAAGSSPQLAPDVGGRVPWRALALSGVVLACIVAALVLRPAGPAAQGPQELDRGQHAVVPSAATPGPDSREPRVAQWATPTPEVPGAGVSSDVPARSGGPDWWATLAELDARRTDALASGDPSRIAGYALPGSPAAEADRSLMRGLAERELRPEGLGSRVLAIESEEQVAEGVLLRVVDLRSGYDLVSAATGDVVQHVAAAPATRWAVTLAPRTMTRAEGPGWQVVAVRRVASGSAEG